MEENKFEKQVQQKLEDLKLEPSDAVWTKIEARLEKQKKHRWGILFLFLFLFMCMSGAYWFWNNSQHSLITKNSSGEKNIEKNTALQLATKEKEKESQHSAAATPLRENNIERHFLVKKNHTNLSTQQKIIFSKKINQKINSKNIVGEEEENTTVVRKPDEKKILKTEDDNLALKSDPENATENKENIFKDTASVEVNNDTLQNKNIVKKTVPAEEVPAKNNAAKPSRPKAAAKHQWKFGVSFTGGTSHVENISSVTNAYAYSTSPSSSTSNPGVIIYGATLKQRPGVALGIVAEKNISTNTRFSIGLNFKTLRSLYKVGNRNDTTGFYNAQNAVHNYNAHVNFIELPLSIKVQFIKSKKLPLFWEGGIVLSQLINTNALQFDPYSGKFYKDNSLFNKTQLGLATSLSAEFFARKRNPVIIGPYLYYGASKIAKEGLYGDKHFIFTGLKATVLF